jgi:glycerol-3-phosphate cytidylyltransferase
VKKVLLVGVFDLFHFGHLRLIQRAATLGDYLIAAVQEDGYILKHKPTEAYYSTEERIEMIRALRVVDEVISYKDIADDIKTIDFDVFVKGPDQTHSGFLSATEWCEANGKSVVTLPRTDGISSTYLKQLLEDFAKR